MIERLVHGQVPAKHHIVLKSDDGELRHEECITRVGFDGPYTIAYHQNRPHVHTPVATNHGWATPAAAATPELRRRHYKTFEIQAGERSAIDSRIPLLFNRDLTISISRPGAEDPGYFANGDGDDLYFIFEGGGLLRSVLGDLRFDKDDYVHIPKGVIHRFIPDSGNQYWLAVETAGAVGVPAQWRNPVGQLRMDAPFCHRDFRTPEFKGPQDEGIRDLVVKRGGAFHGYRYPHNPIDVVGWDGTVYPVAFPILNFQPRAGLVHLPPTWHGTFAARGALICSFVPRVVDFHPEAIPCPYPHSSV
ncbi:MAG: homogentisate 1,2-dioxygenase, partial [Deltaproteobacteria bacterium]|nr:homogentisate 1,2-dioxygenase [Deltaproteobacteria bacterium]